MDKLDTKKYNDHVEPVYKDQNEKLKNKLEKKENFDGVHAALIRGVTNLLLLLLHLIRNMRNQNAELIIPHKY